MKSILIDTNIIVRLLTKDDPRQFEKAQQAFQEIETLQQKGLISLLVLHELVWILEHFYGLKKSIFIPQVQALLSLKNLDFLEVKKSIVFTSLDLMQKHNVDLIDAYLFSIKGKRQVLSFDKDFKKFQ